MESIATPDNAHGKETYCHCENESIGRYVAFGSRTEVSDGHENVGFWGQSGSQFRAAACLFLAMSRPSPVARPILT